LKAGVRHNSPGATEALTGDGAATKVPVSPTQFDERNRRHVDYWLKNPAALLTTPIRTAWAGLLHW